MNYGWAIGSLLGALFADATLLAMGMPVKSIVLTIQLLIAFGGGWLLRDKTG